jgi:hypothetical protein
LLWSSLGIIIYEIFLGYPPFWDLREDSGWENQMMDAVAKDLIENLLVQDQTNRLRAYFPKG